MCLRLTYLLACVFTLSGLLASPRLELMPGLHRIYWESSTESVYLVERSGDLLNWEALGPVFSGDGSELVYEESEPGKGPVFYRLLEVPLENLKSQVNSGSRPPYLAWASEQPDGSLRFDYYALQDSEFVDVHYRLNDAPQLNYRMRGDWPRWHFSTPPLSASDSVSFYFTYEQSGLVVDTVSVAHVMAGANTPPDGDPGEADPGQGGGSGGGSGSGASYSDVLAAPENPADYTHGVDFANGEAMIRLRSGYAPDSMLVNYRLNGGPEQAYFMNEEAGEWRYTLAANEGDSLAYKFYSLTPDHIRSEAFTRVIGSAQPERDEPIVTLGAGRFRDRHENELRFDPYIEGYFDRSTFGVTLIDRGDAVDVVVTPAEPVDFVDIKLYDRLTTPHEERPLDVRADYAQAHRMFEVDGVFYWRIEPVEPGKFVDLEFTLRRTRTGQQYYTAIFRFHVGTGGLVQRMDNPEAYSGGQTTVDVYAETEYSFAQAAHNVQPGTLQTFLNGKQLFDTDFVAEGRGGPLFNAASCFDCHVNDGAASPPSGPGAPATGLLLKLASVQSGEQVPHADYGFQLQDRAVPGATPEGRLSVSYTEVSGSFTDGTPYTLVKPVMSVADLSAGGLEGVRRSPRIAPKVIGLGLLEALPESTLEAWADPDDADSDGISGRINRVRDVESGETGVGRFGWKAGQPSVRQQVALALYEDMGVGNALFGEDEELGGAELTLLTQYTQLLGVPLRRNLDHPDVLAGKALFAAANCTACHQPEAVTRADFPIAELRGQTIRPYTDLLLHDMGAGLADDYTEGEATGSEWRTPPLWGIGRTEEVSGHTRFLHDGRARSLEEAILWHGGEAEAAREVFRSMSASERAQLLAFLNSL